MQFDYGKNVQAYQNRDGTVALGTWSKPFGEGVWQPERTPLIIATWARSLNVPVSSLVEPLDAPHGNPANFWTKSVPLLDPATPAPEADAVPVVTYPVAHDPQRPVDKAPTETPPPEHKPVPVDPPPVAGLPPVHVHVYLPQPVARVVDPAYVPPALPRATEPVPPAQHNAMLALFERWMADARHWL